MHEPPKFLTSPAVIEADETFFPKPLPFRGGWIAWGATVMLGFTLIVIRVQTGGIQCMTISFFLFFLMAALLITFNHWLETNTSIQVSNSHLSYQSPIKKFNQQWDQIKELRARPVGQSWRILIVGSDTSFSIRIASETSPQDHRDRVLELPKGDRLVRIICGMAELNDCVADDKVWICSNLPSRP